MSNFEFERGKHINRVDRVDLYKLIKVAIIKRRKGNCGNGESVYY